MDELAVDDDRRRSSRNELDISARLVKLVLASLLLNALILAAYVTSTPERSPATVWLTAAYRARTQVAALDPTSDPEQLSRLHLDARDISTPECVSCHGDMIESEVLFHRIHLQNELLPGLQCHDCHRRVDLTPRGNRAVVTWVDVGVCKQCHSAFPGSDDPQASMKPMDFEIDCTMCHSGDHAFRHEAPYLSHIIAPSECKGCHGGRVLPWSDAHEEDEWLETHGQEALEKGDESCFECHDFGLKFCDTCHDQTPPSHLPAGQWRARHPDAARADTRACRTCHELAFCSKCHLSHEEGWIGRHPSVVQEQGTDSCWRCHSRSFCSFCHTDVLRGSSEAGPAQR
jgi:hypothetical protein